MCSCSCDSHRDNISNHLQTISKVLDLYLSQYHNIIIVGDFNTGIGKKSMDAFCEKYGLSSPIKEPTFFKNPANLSSVDLILTNSSCNFQNSSVVETGLSDFHRMIVTVFKTTFQRLPQKEGNYRDYSNLDNGMFLPFLVNKSSRKDVENLEKFIKVCINRLHNHTPSKKNILEVVIYHLLIKNYLRQS